MSTQSPAARTALVYVTIGALVLVWTAVWCVWTISNPPEGRGVYYILGGLLASGVTILGIGLGLGRLGSAARHADNPTVIVSPAPLSDTASVVATGNAALASPPAVAPPVKPMKDQRREEALGTLRPTP